MKESEIREMGSAKDAIRNWSYEKFSSRELVYGRKSWELVYALNCDTQNDCMSELKLEDWINLQEKFVFIGPNLSRISGAFHAEDSLYDTPQDKYFRNLYMKWYDQSFPDDDPTLGYDFSVGYMREFWEAADVVLDKLEDPDWEVWMVASY